MSQNSSADKSTIDVESSINMSLNDSTSGTKFERLLRDMERKKMEKLDTSQTTIEIKDKLRAFDAEWCVYRKDVLHTIDFWKQMNLKKKYPELYQLAVLVNAVPVTQVTVERAFSIVAFILSSRRCQLAEKTLSDILLVRLNKQLFQKIICNE